MSLNLQFLIQCLWRNIKMTTQFYLIGIIVIGAVLLTIGLNSLLNQGKR